MGLAYMLLLQLVLFFFSVCHASPQDEDTRTMARHGLIGFVTLVACGLFDNTTTRANKRRKGGRGTTIKRVRRSVSSIMYELGSYSRCFYHMRDESFWMLHRLLKDKIENPSIAPGSRRSRKKRKRGKTPNGDIDSASRLSMALRYFAGGDPLDISLVHGVSHSEVFKSVWLVVDAVHSTPDLDINFPTDHAEQRRIAREFQSKSDAGFDNCAGAIDGILIWIQKPTKDQCDLVQCGAKKFFCGRKKKFGFNMQGTCDARGRFLDVSINHPGATSDYLAFVTSLSTAIQTGNARLSCS